MKKTIAVTTLVCVVGLIVWHLNRPVGDQAPRSESNPEGYVKFDIPVGKTVEIDTTNKN